MDNQLPKSTNPNPFTIIAFFIVIFLCFCCCVSSATFIYVISNGSNPYEEKTLSTAIKTAAEDGEVNISEVIQLVDKASVSKVTGDDVKRTYYFSNKVDGRTSTISVVTRSKKSNTTDSSYDFNIARSQEGTTDVTIVGKLLVIGADAYLQVDGARNQSTTNELNELLKASSGQWIKLPIQNVLPVLTALSSGLTRNTYFDPETFKNNRDPKLLFRYEGSNDEGATCFSTSEKVGSGNIKICETSKKTELKWQSGASVAFMSIEPSESAVDLTPPSVVKTIP